MNKKFDQYVVKETIYGVSNLRLSEAIHIKVPTWGLSFLGRDSYE